MIISVPKKVLNTIKKYQMISKGDKVLVGFSGGPDSVALLCALNELKTQLGIKIYALHINHQLRAKAADEDEKFARGFCKAKRIKIRCVRINVFEYAKKNKMSIEEGARVIRYEYLEKEVKRIGGNKIAVGHNANDNTETVILNLVRGAGLAGLSGIPPVRDKIIRPLIETNRKEILSYLKNIKSNFCHDLTNIELGYRRNFVRHKIVPGLEKINPNLIETILRTSQIIRDTNQCIIKMCEQVKKDVLVKTSSNLIGVDIEKLLSYNVLIRREIIKQMLPKMEFEQIEKVIALAKKSSGTKLELSDNWLAWREYNKIFIGFKKQNAGEFINQSWQVNIGKKISIPEIGMEIITKSFKGQSLQVKKYNDNNYALFDKSKINLPLSLRMRRAGDRFIPFKGKETKLKDIMINDKIPTRARDRLPLLCDEKNILWIIGSRRSNFGLINNKTKEILEVKVIKWQNNPFVIQ
jgi:tRNA(Ile)-lysidine synthase